MYYNNGSIDINGTKKDADKVLAFLRKTDDRFILRSLWKIAEDSYCIDLNTMDGGNLADTLKKLVDFSDRENLNVTFDVRFMGNCAGGYIYNGSTETDTMQELSESECVIHDASDEELLAECRRRGLIDPVK